MKLKSNRVQTFESAANAYKSLKSASCADTKCQIPTTLRTMVPMRQALRRACRLYHADRSEIIWLPEHIEAFMPVAPVELQRGLILGLHTGQRQGAILRLPWSAYDGQWIGLRQGKGYRKRIKASLLEIPCTVALRQMLDGMERVSH